MAKRSTLGLLSKLINFLLTLSGLSVLFLGVYCLIKWIQNSHKTHQENLDSQSASRVSTSDHHLKNGFDRLASAWFIFLFMAIGTLLFFISCLGYLGTDRGNSCYLSCYSVLLFGLLLAELIVAAFFLFNQNFSEDMLHFDKTGDFRSIYHFVRMNWKIIRWVILLALILEVIALVIALYLRSMNQAVYDGSDDEIIVNPGSHQARTDERRTPATGTHDRENLVVV